MQLDTTFIQNLRYTHSQESVTDRRKIGWPKVRWQDQHPWRQKIPKWLRSYLCWLFWH